MKVKIPSIKPLEMKDLEILIEKVNTSDLNLIYYREKDSLSMRTL